jgi:sigma-B regulation protein RsbU (phosphoserine phosphatase)
MMAIRPAVCLLAVLCFLIVFSFSAVAQTVDLSHWPDGSIHLNGAWRVHSGDNTAYARPDFDDSGWPTVSFTDQSQAKAGWRWYRLLVKLPAQHAPLALLIVGGDGTYEVYVNGDRLAGPKLKSSLLVTYPKERAISLPDTGGEVGIALRTYVPKTSMFVADRGAWKVDVGTAAAIENVRRTAESDRLNQAIPGVVINLLVGLAGLAMLALFWFERQHREYLWLGLFLLLLGIGTGIFELAAVSSFLPFSANWFLADPTECLCTIALIEFTFSFVGQRVNRAWRLYEALLLVIPLLVTYSAWHGIITRAFVNLVEVLALTPAGIGLPILLLVWFRRGNREAGWLILPTLLSVTALALNDIAIVAGYFGWTRGWLLTPPIFGGFTLQSFDIADLLFLLAISIVIFSRFTRVNREQARSAAELEAAREIQQRLVPISLPAVPGYRIEAAYLPAEEVGGDFYQILEQEDGSILVVVGDVSGKGLKAAMTGALAIGALRTLASEGLGPAVLLARLNRQIVGTHEAGFITCICARISARDGLVTVANAGHLAPYCSGEELVLDSGLPLGIIETEYSEFTFPLAMGNMLTFLSDGVVEAMNSNRELFGFDRTRQISRQSARSIAEAARQFGQQDDITVLTLTMDKQKIPESSFRTSSAYDSIAIA